MHITLAYAFSLDFFIFIMSLNSFNISYVVSSMNWGYRLLPYKLDDNAKTFLKNLTVHLNIG